MESFNIVIDIQNSTYSLTVQPEEAGTYKIIYHGALVGAITMGQSEGIWEALPVDELDPGIFPMYEHDAEKDEVRIVLDAETVKSIGAKIASYPN